MFKGYLELGGTELLNAERVWQYVTKQLPAFPLKKVYDTKDLQEALQDEEYSSPLVDDAPWTDPSNPSTFGFYGFYPLDVQGIQDSTREATITQSLGDGGFSSATRFATKELRIKAMGVARDKAAADAGMAWLRAALNPGGCAGDDCGGQQLCYFVDAPVVCDTYTGLGGGAGSGESFGRVDPSSSPMTFRFPDFSPAKASVTWSPIFADGAIVRWGAMRTDSSQIIQIDGAGIRLQRTNWIPNPSFTTGLTGWTGSGMGTFARVTSGGVDTGPFARMTTGGTVTVRTNWFANSGVSQDPTEANDWHLAGGGAIVVDTVNPQGTLSAPRSPFSALFTGPVGASVTIPILLPQASTIAAFSIDQLGGAIRAHVVKPDGTDQGYSDFVANSAWTRRVLPAQAWGVGYTLRLEKRDAAPVNFTDLLLDTSGSNVWFDGNVDDVAGYSYEWTGNADASPSIRRDTSILEPVTNLLSNPQFNAAAVTTDGTTAVAATLARVTGQGWASNGTALSVTPNSAASLSYASLQDGGMPLKAGHSYTVQGLIFLSAAQTGTLDANARRIVVSYTDPVSGNTVLVASNQAANATGTTFVRLSVDIPAGATNIRIRLMAGATNTATNTVFFSDLLATEVTSAATPYLGDFFSGRTAPVQSIRYDFADGTPNTESLQVTSLGNVNVVTTAPIDAYSHGVTFSAALRSLIARTPVRVEMVSTVDGSIVGAALLNVGTLWSRSGITFPWGRAFRLRIISAFGYDIDQALLEYDGEARPYFDGDSEAAAGYDATWDSTPNNSLSYLRYALPLKTERDDADWRPFLSLEEGAIAGGTYTWGVQGADPFGTSFEHLERHLNDVTAISGPTIDQEADLGQKGYLFTVEYGLSAQKPFIFGNPRTLLVANPGDLVSEPYYDTGTLLSRNLWTDPSSINVANFERVLNSGAASIAVLAPSVTAGLPTNFGPNSRAAVATVTTAMTVTALLAVRNKLTTPILVTPGQTYSFSCYGAVGGTALPAGTTANVVLRWVDNIGTILSTVTVPVASISATAFQRYKIENVVAPSGAYGATVGIQITNSTNQLPVGLTLWQAAIQANVGATVTATASGLFTDTTTRQYEWEGAVNASPSRVYEPWQCAVNTIDSSLLDDPDCDPVPAPPRPPAVPALCIEDVEDWTRYFVPISAEEVAAWSATVPTITLTTLAQDIRQVRVRFFPNPFGYDKDKFDPCSWCSEFILSYLPPSTTLTVDGERQKADASVGGRGDQPADHLLYGTGGAPITWPEMSCGVPYWMTVDIPADVVAADLGIELVVTRKE